MVDTTDYFEELRVEILKLSGEIDIVLLLKRRLVASAQAVDALGPEDGVTHAKILVDEQMGGLNGQFKSLVSRRAAVVGQALDQIQNEGVSDPSRLLALLDSLVLASKGETPDPDPEPWTPDRRKA